MAKLPNEMSVLDHLEELRWRIFYVLGSVILFSVGCWFISEFLLEALLTPIPSGLTLQMLKPTEGFIVRLKLSFTGGIFFALPVIIYQVWQFVAPGLFEHEKKYIIPILIAGTGFFFVGSAFAYFVVMPFALNFLHSFATPDIQDVWALGEYITFATRLLLAFGVVFEMPVVAFFLAKIGILSPAFMREKRSIAVVVILVLGAILTPPDIFSQVLMALPLFGLYELSILVAQMTYKPAPFISENEAENS